MLHLFVETAREMGKSDAEIAAELRAMANKLAREVRKTAEATGNTVTPKSTKTGHSIGADRRASRTGLAFLTAVGTGNWPKPAKGKNGKRPMA